MKRYELPLTTEIEVVARKDDRIVKQIMTYGKALELLKKRNGWHYDLYQVGFCSLKEK